MVDHVSPTSTEPIENLRSSMRETMHEGVELLNAEMRLLMAETSSNLKSQISAAVALVVAGVLALVGLVLLAAAAAWFLAVWLGSPGLAYLIVAVAVMLIAVIIFVVAKRRLSLDQLVPHRFLRTLNAMRFDIRARRHG